MYNDEYALKGMTGSALLNTQNLTITRKGVLTYFRIPKNPQEKEFKLQYVDEIPKYEGYQLTARRKLKISTSVVNAEFLELKGKKHQSLRTARNKYSEIVIVESICEIEPLIDFIHSWKNSYGKQKYGMRLHTGYDIRFLQDYFNHDDYYSFVFKIENKIVGLAVISRHENNGALNYIIGKADHAYPQLSEFVSYSAMHLIHFMRGDYRLCWGAGSGTLHEYKMKFNTEVSPCYFLTYKRKEETKSAILKEKLGIVPINVWDSTSQNWRLGKSKWNELIDTAGILSGVENPRFATREDCLGNLGEFSKAVTGKEINGGASVLDPFACEIILKLFMPKKGKKIYNPFGGGVQMGFIAGFFGYEYLATDIRQNQCDANNAICTAMQMQNVRWKCADSSVFLPKEKFDMIFSCPPYYKVEKYVDYNGHIPERELNSQASYEVFREMLFAGYRIAIDQLRENSFVIIMLGDSRDKHGAYYGAEAETELFLKSCGLHIYNRIVFLEHQITRLALSTITIQSRKLPKVEQKILVAYKGNLNNIPQLFEQIEY